MTKVNTVLEDGHFQHGGDGVPTFQFRRQLAKVFMDDTIGMDSNYVGSPEVDTSDPTVLCCFPRRFKPYQGRYIKRKNKSENICT